MQTNNSSCRTWCDPAGCGYQSSPTTTRRPPRRMQSEKSGFCRAGVPYLSYGKSTFSTKFPRGPSRTSGSVSVCSPFPRRRSQQHSLRSMCRIYGLFFSFLFLGEGNVKPHTRDGSPFDRRTYVSNASTWKPPSPGRVSKAYEERAKLVAIVARAVSWVGLDRSLVDLRLSPIVPRVSPGRLGTWGWRRGLRCLLPAWRVTLTVGCFDVR